MMADAVSGVDENLALKYATSAVRGQIAHHAIRENALLLLLTCTSAYVCRHVMYECEYDDEFKDNLFLANIVSVTTDCYICRFSFNYSVLE